MVPISSADSKEVLKERSRALTDHFLSHKSAEIFLPALLQRRKPAAVHLRGSVQEPVCVTPSQPSMTACRMISVRPLDVTRPLSS